MAYATLQDVYALGLAAPAFVSQPRPFDAVDATTATIRLRAHGLSATDKIEFRCPSGGALPTGISQFVSYYPVPISFDLFRISTSAGGSPIASWAGAGGGWSIAVDPSNRIQQHLEDTAAIIDEHLTAHAPPLQRDALGKYPAVIVGLNARMAARNAVNSLQVENGEYRIAIDRLVSRELQDQAMLDAWKAGKPVQPRPVDEDDVPDNGAKAAYSFAHSEWTRSAL